MNETEQQDLARILALDDELLEKLVYKHFSGNEQRPFLHTSWKDGIDVDYPTLAYKNLVADLIAPFRTLAAENAALVKEAEDITKNLSDSINKRLEGGGAGWKECPEYIVEYIKKYASAIRHHEQIKSSVTQDEIDIALNVLCEAVSKMRPSA